MVIRAGLYPEDSWFTPFPWVTINNTHFYPPESPALDNKLYSQFNFK